MTQICLALDVPADLGLFFAVRLREYLGAIKVGPAQFYKYPEYPTLVKEVIKLPVFLDLKLHDSPSIVAQACESLVGRCDYLTVHAAGGTEMLEAAVEAVQGRYRLLAVVNISSDSRKTTGLTEHVDQVARTKVAGIVCSSLAAIEYVKERHPELVVFTPVVRMDQGIVEDDRVVITIEEAVSRKVEMVVVGQPITQAATPAEGVAYCEELFARCK